MGGALSAIGQALFGFDAGTVLTDREIAVIRRINNALANNLEAGPKGDISETLSEMPDSHIRRQKLGPGWFDHIEEVKNSLKSLRKWADSLASSTDPIAAEARKRALCAITEIDDAIKGAGL